MPAPAFQSRAALFSVISVLLGLAVFATIHMAFTSPLTMYVPAGTPRSGFQNWVPDAEHIARGVSCVVFPNTNTDPSSLQVTFNAMAGPGPVTIRILRLEGSSSRQGPLDLTPPPEPLTLNPRAEPTLTWTHPTPLSTNLRKAGNNAETLHFTIHFEITRSDQATEHTMTYDWIPRRF